MPCCLQRLLDWGHNHIGPPSRAFRLYISPAYVCVSPPGTTSFPALRSRCGAGLVPTQYSARVRAERSERENEMDGFLIHAHFSFLGKCPQTLSQYIVQESRERERSETGGKEEEEEKESNPMAKREDGVEKRRRRRRRRGDSLGKQISIEKHMIHERSETVLIELRHTRLQTLRKQNYPSPHPTPSPTQFPIPTHPAPAQTGSTSHGSHRTFNLAGRAMARIAPSIWQDGPWLASHLQSGRTGQDPHRTFNLAGRA